MCVCVERVREQEDKYISKNLERKKTIEYIHNERVNVSSVSVQQEVGTILKLKKEITFSRKK